MADVKGVSLVEHFEDLEDPRVERTKLHQLRDIIVIAICAVICGADNWVEIEEFGRAKRDWLEALLGIPNGIPSHDTFGRVFARLDAEKFEACFVKWVQHLHELTQGQLLAIDGKTVRRSHDRRQKKGPLHLVSAWATESRLVLGQTEVTADICRGDTPLTTATDHGERLAQLEGAYEHLATKAGIERLQASIIKWIVGVGLASATLAAAVASTVVTLVLS
ncbi:MAG: ISAs1 family transposase [Caldilineaceae bacterium]|nr:ISAs1 family transposase [Caldilineaceae bacterium]